MWHPSMESSSRPPCRSPQSRGGSRPRVRMSRGRPAPDRAEMPSSGVTASACADVAPSPASSVPPVDPPPPAPRMPVDPRGGEAALCRVVRAGIVQSIIAGIVQSIRAGIVQNIRAGIVQSSQSTQREDEVLRAHSDYSRATAELQQSCSGATAECGAESVSSRAPVGVQEWVLRQLLGSLGRARYGEIRAPLLWGGEIWGDTCSASLGPAAVAASTTAHRSRRPRRRQRGGEQDGRAPRLASHLAAAGDAARAPVALAAATLAVALATARATAVPASATAVPASKRRPRGARRIDAAARASRAEAGKLRRRPRGGRPLVLVRHRLTRSGARVLRRLLRRVRLRLGLHVAQRRREALLQRQDTRRGRAVPLAV